MLDEDFHLTTSIPLRTNGHKNACRRNNIVVDEQTVSSCEMRVLEDRIVHPEQVHCSYTSNEITNSSVNKNSLHSVRTSCNLSRSLGLSKRWHTRCKALKQLILLAFIGIFVISLGVESIPMRNLQPQGKNYMFK